MGGRRQVLGTWEIRSVGKREFGNYRFGHGNSEKWMNTRKYGNEASEIETQGKRERRREISRPAKRGRLDCEAVSCFS